VRSSRLTKLLLVLLIVVPGFLNFYTPLYNYPNPALDGMPFFYWFQIVLLGSMVVPYLIFSYIEERRTAATQEGQ
jgi:hypothetical protein